MRHRVPYRFPRHQEQRAIGPVVERSRRADDLGFDGNILLHAELLRELG